MVSTEIILSNLTTSFNINKAFNCTGFSDSKLHFVRLRDDDSRTFVRVYYFHFKI